MTVALTSVLAAGIAVAWSFLATDPVRASYWMCWARKEYRTFRAANTLIHLLAVLVIVLGSSALAWVPEDGDGIGRCLAIGIAWGTTAALLLRAEFSGLRSDEALPAGTLLRAVLARMVGWLDMKSSQNINSWLDHLTDQKVLNYALWCISQHFGTDTDPRRGSALSRDCAYERAFALYKDRLYELRACAHGYAATWTLCKPAQLSADLPATLARSG